MAEKYVDSFVMPLAKLKVADYEKFAAKLAVIANRHGAEEYVNCIADDVKPGKETSFPQAVKLTDDEVVVQSWAIYPSREARDKANQAIRNDPEFQKMMSDMPVDGKRMFTGGFKVLRGL
jgi:uncharacterized protein YbaA (DUF1428 family)